MQSNRIILGIDIGSVTTACVAMNHNGEFLLKKSVFHHGQPEKALSDLLRSIDQIEVDSIVTTSSSPKYIAAEHRYDDQLAAIRAARADYPDLRGVLLVGGEKFSLSRFDSSGQYLGSSTNSSCAAGTGSFLDQQAGRLQLDGASELGALAHSCKGDCPKIASRCAVFAKTDLIHAQQEGFQLDEISDGLCRGLAKNIVDTLFTAPGSADEPLVFCGGVSKNRAVATHIEELLDCTLQIPENGHLYGAIGACLLEQERLEKHPHLKQEKRLLSWENIIKDHSNGEKDYSYPPLQLHLSEYPDFSSNQQYSFSPPEGGAEVEVDIYTLLPESTEIPVELGIDIGSTSTKAILLDDRSRVLAGFYTRTAGNPLKAVQNIFSAIEEIENKNTITFHVQHCGTTGSGRKFIGTLIGADGIIDEITAHARAASQLNPKVDTIIEIGGQDAKFTTLRDGMVTSATMNNVCAAGTGSFIEEQAEKLGCSIREYSTRAEKVRAPMTSDRCTVFMERDINHFLSEGYSVDEVLASALHSVRENYLLKVATEKNIGEVVLFQGATAKNRALVAAFEQKLKKPILVSKYCHLTGALGTALLIQEECQEQTKFRGFALCRQKIPLSSETCQLCTNHCKITLADIGGERVAYGFLCGRDYEADRFVRKENTGRDLLSLRKKLARFKPKTEPKGPLIGLPAAVHMVEELPMWQKFFDLLGLPVMTSENCPSPVATGKKQCQAEFCSPTTAMHGHVAYLLQKCDYVFLPFYLENKTGSTDRQRKQYCYYTQFLPALAASTPALDDKRILRPLVKYLFSSFHTKVQLYRMLQKIAPDRWNIFEVAGAFDSARSYFADYQDRLKQHSCVSHPEKDDIRVVFLGRPYTLLSKSLNCNIPNLFASLGIDTDFQDMVDYNAEELKPAEPLLAEIRWQYCAKILETAQAVANREGVYPVFVTSFKCSPDSFGVEYFKKLMDQHQKPYLILELDEHGSSVGYETRIEAAVRAFRNHAKAEQRRKEKDHGVFTTFIPSYTDNLKDKHLFFPNWDRITCSFLTSVLRREGIKTHLLKETETSIRQSLQHNSGQCIPLNGVCQSFMNSMRETDIPPEQCVLWLNRSTLACNIGLYPYHIQHILKLQPDNLGQAAIYTGELSLADISFRAAKNAYFAYMFGGLLRKVACRIRPYEVHKGQTDRILDRSISILSDAFEGKRPLDKTLEDVITRFEWIETKEDQRPQVAIFGDLYSRDNRVINQDLIRFIEKNGGEVITTPYTDYAKMIAPSYFRKWFNEGKYLNVLTNRTILAAMIALEKSYRRIFNRVLKEPDHSYSDEPAKILSRFFIAPETSGESMDNILKVHYLTKHYPNLALMVQASPALCCASLITEGMRHQIEKVTSIPVASITYDGTGGSKNEILIPYLQFAKDIRRSPQPNPLSQASI